MKLEDRWDISKEELMMCEILGYTMNPNQGNTYMPDPNSIKATIPSEKILLLRDKLFEDLNIDSSPDYLLTRDFVKKVILKRLGLEK